MNPMIMIIYHFQSTLTSCGPSINLGAMTSQEKENYMIYFYITVQKKEKR